MRAHSLFTHIYPVTSSLDNRVRFILPAGTDNKGFYIYLMFPGGNIEEHEIEELVVDPNSLEEWIS